VSGIDGRPSYLSLSPDEMAARVDRAIEALADCRACPRDCGVNRLEDRWAACKTGRQAVVTSAFAHLGEEDCLRGWNGSGTVFFAHCNLRCVFCQNADISQNIRPESLHGTAPRQLAAIMLALQAEGCHNVNFVTPEHVVPQIVEALAEAIPLGLEIPIVYNTSAYDSIESLALMDGLVDIYMPDFKYWSAGPSKTYLKAADYPEHARMAIRTMHDQVGPLVIEHGLAQRGLLIRHLVMPGALDETRAILEWIGRELGPGTYVNLMDQYRPAGTVTAARYGEINRTVNRQEFQTARDLAQDLGLRLDERRWRRPRDVGV
jgi:putative pyruvate formate lyase activating enzyme